jgi:uncharacterized protein YndB with AHSA1/START domain
MVASDPVVTSTFRLLTAASAARVWSVLTCPETAPSYLHGLSPRTCFTPGAAVEWRGGAEFPVIPGQVLHADPPYRLSLTVEDGSGTCTYLTWTIRAGDHGTVVRLDIAESDAAASGDAELEDVWLPVLERLAEVLREPVM